MKYFHILTVLGSIGAGAQLIDVLSASTISAPQQAAGAAIAVALAVIPYCLVRALTFMTE